jgi:hypothetical protein
VESQNVVLDWHLIEENSEDTLLHLSGVLRTEDNHLLFRKVDCNRGSRSHALSISVGGERSSVVNGVVWVEVLEIFSLRSDEHVSHEQSMVCTSADDSNSDAVFFIPSCESVDNINAVSGVQIIDSTLSVDSPDLYHTR